MAPRNHAACVGSYCDAILSGEIIAGRYVELAVRRYIDDLEHAHERGLGSFLSSSDSTGGSVDAVEEDGPWDETELAYLLVHWPQLPDHIRQTIVRSVDSITPPA